tara:strand:+ start:84 stop:341 length:258 start_codon:yes stop_codon:yes gene_type:complete
MGWWSITDKNGGISPFGNIGLYNGDGPADIIDNAIKEVIKEYEEAWGRKPYIQELQAVWNFCTATVLEDELEHTPDYIMQKQDQL